MGILVPEVVVVKFDAEGNYLETSFKEIRPDVLSTNGDRQWMEPAAESVEIAVRQAEIVFRPETISVKAFLVEDWGIGVTDMPDHFAEMLESPEENGVSQHYVEEEMQRWRDEGDFVLFWGNDYWLDKTGEVTSS